MRASQTYSKIRRENPSENDAVSADGLAARPDPETGRGAAETRKFDTRVSQAYWEIRRENPSENDAVTVAPRPVDRTSSFPSG